MKVRILENIVSVHGTFTPFQVVKLPEETARVWIAKGVVSEIILHKPDEIPEGLFWCEKHVTLHRLDSSVGKKCIKNQTREEEEEEEEETEEEEKEEEKKEESTDEKSQGEQGEEKRESGEEEDKEEGGGS